MVYQIAFWRFFTKDKTLSGRPSDADKDDIKALIELDYHVTLREIEEKLKIPKSTIHRESCRGSKWTISCPQEF